MTENQDKMEKIYNNLCRICLKNSDNMKELFTYRLAKEEIHVVDFIRKMTGLKLAKSDTLPSNLCSKCEQNIRAAFDLAQLCIASDVSLRNLETRRMLRKIEQEALGEEEIEIKCEVLNEHENVEVQQNEHLDVDEISDENFSENEETPQLTQNDINFTTIKTKDKYKCDKCSLSFNNKTKFQKHQKTHDDSKPFKCNECLQSFSKRLHLNVHLRSHIKQEDKRFSCEKCGLQFIYEYLLKQHEYKHTDKKPFPCTKCNKGCLTAESLRRHMKIHEETYTKKTHSCYICQKDFPYPSFLAEHMKNHTGEKPYLCSICGKGFRQSGALHYHQRIHTGYKPFPCKICDENFRSQSVLKVHMRKHTNERPYVCDICGMSFRQCTDLKSHHRTHTGEKPVLCTICGKKMSTTGQLTVHLRSHTGEKPYSCTICSRSFTTRTILVKHERIHTGERPYVCDVCGKAFNQSSTLRTHAKTHNNVSSNKKKKKPKHVKSGNREIRLENNAVVLFKNESGVSEAVSEQYLVDNVVEISEEQCESVKTEFTVILPAPIPLLQNM